MNWYHYLVSLAFLVCLTSLLFHLVRLIKAGGPRDHSRRRGNVASAMVYSFLGSMSPAKKESAYLHLPTYAAGLLYHFGTFVSIVLFFLFFLHVNPGEGMRRILIGILLVSVMSGVGILSKRMAVRKIRSLSNPDDYISNLLVTIFQFLTIGTLLEESFAPFYFLWVSLLLLYLPLGKLKHALYFFAARYHLGLFYGWRGIWPGKTVSKWHE